METKPLVAVLAGGDSGEYEISLKSANMIVQAIDNERFEPILVLYRNGQWTVHYQEQQLTLDVNDWTFYDGEHVHSIQLAYNVMHGNPGEDGTVPALLDLAGIPYPNSGVLASALTMNKHLSKRTVASLGIPVAKDILYREDDPIIDVDAMIETLGLPLFIKPNNGGSSLATFKIKSAEDVEDAIEQAFDVDSEVLAEQFMAGREITMGAYVAEGELHYLPPTEIIPHNEFFDYEAKYQGKSKEVTPADIPQNILQQMQRYVKSIYRTFNLKGLVRIDFMLSPDQTLYFMEVNTLPGFSEQSIVPQQIRASGKTETQVLTELLLDVLDFNDLD
ncbi:MAG: D-alanine--D-alanine ligase [Bacteroidetes bacterium]|jgi:D-alanine-D-alanine ligase|nr:D-alanine--D-alanine ligase [Bacteroidota bacterium]